jgi:outer membrane protein TolC
MWERIAVTAAQQSVECDYEQYKADTVSYMHLLTAQTIAVTNETKQSRSL